MLVYRLGEYSMNKILTIEKQLKDIGFSIRKVKTDIGIMLSIDNNNTFVDIQFCGEIENVYLFFFRRTDDTYFDIEVFGDKLPEYIIKMLIDVFYGEI